MRKVRRSVSTKSRKVRAAKSSKTRKMNVPKPNFWHSR